MAIANGTNFATSAGQETYATTKEWTLPSGDGLKTVCIKFYNMLDIFLTMFALQFI
jgi:hypothetical protein